MNCQPAAPACAINTIQAKYQYNTTCSGVVSQKSGGWSWSLEAAQAKIAETEEQLKQQLTEQGWSLHELRFQWQPTDCSAANAAALPLVPSGIVRLVLEPAPTTDSGVAPLLVCRPTGAPTTSLQQNMLLACTRGNSPQIACTIQLTSE